MSWYAIDYEHDKDWEREIVWADACEDCTEDCESHEPGTYNCQRYLASLIARWQAGPRCLPLHRLTMRSVKCNKAGKYDSCTECYHSVFHSINEKHAECLRWGTCYQGEDKKEVRVRCERYEKELL